MFVQHVRNTSVPATKARHLTGKDAEDGRSERLLKERKEDKDEDSREKEHLSGAVKSSTDFLDQKETPEIGTASRSGRDDLDVGEVRSDEKMPKDEERIAGREEANVLMFSWIPKFLRTHGLLWSLQTV